MPKNEKKKKKLCVNEFDTLKYEQQIVENNRQLARLRTCNEELEEKSEQLKKELKKLEEDKSDVIAHLKRCLEIKTSESQELQKKVQSLEQLLKDEQIAFKKKTALMVEEFNTMEATLNNELKLAAGKLNSLEDWRLQRIDVMRKFEEQEKQIAEQEARHKQALYDAEKKLIIGKANMQKELELRLSELGRTFREASTLRLADATRRALRENAMKSRELTELLKLCHELDDQLQDEDEKAGEHQLRSSLMEAEAELALKQLQSYARKTEELADKHAKNSAATCRAIRAEQWAARLQKNYEETMRKCQELERDCRILAQNIQMAREHREDYAQEARDNSAEIDRLSRILEEARDCIREALQLRLEDDDEDPCTCCFEDVKGKLLHSLLDILADYQPQLEDLESSVEDAEEKTIENVYEFGNLGLIPTQVGVNETEESVMAKSKELESQ